MLYNLDWILATMLRIKQLLFVLGLAEKTELVGGILVREVSDRGER